MKKLALFLLLLPSVALANQYCFYDWTRGACENSTLTVAGFCTTAYSGDVGWGMYSLCQDALEWRDSAGYWYEKANSCSANYSSCVASFNVCTADYNNCAATAVTAISQRDANATSLSQWQAHAASLDAANKKARALEKKLRKACGSKCKKIK